MGYLTIRIQVFIHLHKYGKYEQRQIDLQIELSAVADLYTVTNKGWYTHVRVHTRSIQIYALN